MKNYLDIEKCLVWLDSFLGFEYKHKKIIFDSVDESTSISEFISLVKEYIKLNLGDKENLGLLSSLVVYGSTYAVNSSNTFASLPIPNLTVPAVLNKSFLGVFVFNSKATL